MIDIPLDWQETLRDSITPENFLVFSDWLEENGQSDTARYLRWLITDLKVIPRKWTRSDESPFIEGNYKSYKTIGRYYWGTSEDWASKTYPGTSNILPYPVHKKLVGNNQYNQYSGYPSVLEAYLDAVNSTNLLITEEKKKYKFIEYGAFPNWAAGLMRSKT